MNTQRFLKYVLTLSAAGYLAIQANATWNFTKKTFEDTPKSSIAMDSDDHYVMAYIVNGNPDQVKLRHWKESISQHIDSLVLTAPVAFYNNSIPIYYNIDSVSVAVEPGTTDTICVAYTKQCAQIPDELELDALNFEYILGTISSGSWSGSTSVPLAYRKYGNGDYVPDAWTWFDPDSCAYDIYTEETYPYEIYSDEDQLDQSNTYAFDSTIQVENVGGMFWFACSAGSCISHVAANPTDYRFEQHSAFYLLNETNWEGNEYMTDPATDATREFCEPQNSYWQYPAGLDGNLSGDPGAGSIYAWHLACSPTVGGSSVGYMSGLYTSLIGTLSSNASHSMVVARNDTVYVVYREYPGPKVWFRSADLSAGAPSWSTATQIGGTGVYVGCIGASSNGANLYSVIVSTSADNPATLYSGTTSQGLIKDITSGNFFGDRYVVTSGNLGAMLIEYGEEDRHGDIDYDTAIATQQ